MAESFDVKLHDQALTNTAKGEKQAEDDYRLDDSLNGLQSPWSYEDN